MMGTGTFAAPTLEALLASPHQVVGLFTQPDRAVGQERGSTRQTGKGMKTIAAEKGIPVFQPESVNTPQGVADLKSLRPDLLVVAAYGQILSNDVLGVTPHGGINVHASLLPKYRGAAPIAWAIYHGEKQTGVTIIQMSVQLDAGGMIAQEAVEIGPQETAGELEARLAPMGAQMALQVIEQIAAGTARPLPQDKSQVTKAPKLKKEDGLIDWSRDADQVCNQVRAMQPWPTAYTFLHRANQPAMRLIVARATVMAPIAPGSGPGMILPDPSRLLVATGTGVVEVIEMQPAGKRRMPAIEFLRGRPIKDGDRFGPETP
ncbi:MAG: methionyl-tRNA formyltransferase [Gemmataceae bacterium]|nr:methionyl-tRNA formyltransferase [Gemmataceae bacterium]